MYCKYCGCSLEDNAVYCTKCGKKVSESPEKDNEGAVADVAGGSIDDPQNLTKKRTGSAVPLKKVMAVVLSILVLAAELAFCAYSVKSAMDARDYEIYCRQQALSYQKDADRATAMEPGNVMDRYGNTDFVAIGLRNAAAAARAEAEKKWRYLVFAEADTRRQTVIAAFSAVLLLATAFVLILWMRGAKRTKTRARRSEAPGN